MNTRLLQKGLTVTVVSVLALAAGCGLLDVEDPQRFTDEDLNTEQAGQAVANGVLGDFHATVDAFNQITAILADEYIHTGTWNGWEEISNGVIRPESQNGRSDGPFNALIRARWAAQDAQSRLQEILEDAQSSEAMSQIQTVEALANLYLAMGYCEAPAEPGGPAVTDQEMFQVAEREFTEALQGAEAGGHAEWAQLAQAGRARARLMLGNYDGALADAETIPMGFVYYADMSTNSDRQNNDIVQLSNKDFNRAAGVHPNWWPQVDIAAGLLMDPWTEANDPRVPIWHEEGALGVDGNTRYFSEMKFTTLQDDIRVTHWQEMRLIEAEVYWRNGQLAEAMDKINTVREAAGLPALDMPESAEQVKAYLLHERFAEFFLEGQRLQDLHRFEMVEEVLGPNRVTKLPISSDEINANQNIDFPRPCPTGG